MEATDWHIFLAVARQGSTLAASRVLSVSQSTVSRRIDALERAIAVELFERRPSGYVLTPAGEHLVPRAEAIVLATAEALSAARQFRRGLTGQVRITAPVAFGQTFMSAAIRDFRQTCPDISVELFATEEKLDLLAGEADVALRTGPRPDLPGLVARRVLIEAWSIYCSQGYAAANDVPRSASDLARHPVISLSAGFRNSPLALWMDQAVPEEAIVLRYHDVPGLLSGLRNGLGVGLMSDTVAAASGLVRCFVPPVTETTPLWIVTTERLRHEPRIRAFVDFLAGYMTQGRYRLGADARSTP
ncbi:LysR family transcriptional regulator [Paragemmobacter straminiformis]|uniref:LysR family transcriptional regulator n=1 Tax=Paragemmobacter straminiformis TaxID=2045119 RepID=A0A842I513_9RHOB|nr:LysR family transcriptional regulator [Gemmobacter straminiformis]MBC2834038.1 LysR family transcriptional regulator [Gemmobacter straminiformis]